MNLITLDVIQWGGYVIAGILAVIGAFSLQRKNYRTADDAVAANLIQNLKLTVDQEKEKTAALTTKLDGALEQLHIMKGRNQVLEELFNGNENSVLAFIKQAPKLISLAESNSQGIADLTQSIQTLVTGLLKAGHIEPAPQLIVKS